MATAAGLGSTPAQRAHLLALVLGTLALYAYGLSWAPVHLHFDEIRFAEQARSIATTGHDLRGRFLPVYFQMEATVWFHPIGVYLPALLFKIVHVSVTAVRAPTAIVGALDVLLLYFIARRLFRSHDLALLSGALLATSPAHLIHSRMAVDYLFPTPFVLGWCLLLLEFLETRATRTLIAATALLGLGLYSYIAAVALMPLLLAVTIVLLWVEHTPARVIVLAIAAFALMTIPAAWFMATHPEMIGSTLGRYGIAATQLDAFQRLRETLTPWFISDRANLYLTFFSPGYLFVTGGGALAGSTRTAGVFLAVILPLMLIGMREALIAYSPSRALIVAGVFVPPLAASVVNEPFAVGRAITMVPFVTLVAVLGVQRLLAARSGRRLAPPLRIAGVGAAIVAVLYLGYRGLAGDVSSGALLLLGLAVVLVALSWRLQTQSSLRPIVIAILLVGAWQFSAFAKDYFGDYRVRSAFWFNGNVAGAVHRIVDEVDQHRDQTPAVFLDQGINSVDWYWRFHLAELGRSDLAGLLQPIDRDNSSTVPLPAGSLILVPALDTAFLASVEGRGAAVVATITDPGDGNGPDEQPSYVLLRAR